MLKSIGGVVVYGLAVYGASILLHRQRRLVRKVLQRRHRGPIEDSASPGAPEGNGEGTGIAAA